MRKYDTFDDVLAVYKDDAMIAFKNSIWYEVVKNYEKNAQELYASYEPYQYQRRGSLGKNLELDNAGVSINKYGGETEYLFTDKTEANTKYGGDSFPLLALIEGGQDNTLGYKYDYPYNRHGIGEYTKPRPILSEAVAQTERDDIRSHMRSNHEQIAEYGI